MKEFHVKEPLYIVFYNMKTIQSLLVRKNASNCSKMSKKVIRRFYDIIK